MEEVIKDYEERNSKLQNFLLVCWMSRIGKEDYDNDIFYFLHFEHESSL